jgi:predicted nucleic acid-binding protein
MAANYQVRATVVDIRHDQPRDNEIFVIDTNVWLWMTYTRASIGANIGHQVSEYSSYFQKCLVKQGQFFFCGLTLAELAHVIEKMEHEIYQKVNATQITAKEFRHNFQAERSLVVNEIGSSWAQVKALGDCLDTSIDEDSLEAAELKLTAFPVDGYDVFIHELMDKHGVHNILTDDGDFSTVPNISMFTANQNVLTAAQQQGRLLNR